MNERPNSGESIFRQEALDEFSSRLRGDVLKLPGVKKHWLLLLAVVWIFLVFVLLALLPWQEAFLISVQPNRQVNVGTTTITFVLPAHLAYELRDQPVEIMVQGHMVLLKGQLKATNPETWWQHLANISARYRLVKWVVELPDSSDPSNNAIRLRIVSKKLADLCLFRALGYTSLQDTY